MPNIRFGANAPLAVGGARSGQNFVGHELSHRKFSSSSSTIRPHSVPIICNKFLIIFLVLLSILPKFAAAVDGDYRLWCYTGLKYHVGQEVRQDNMECKEKFTFKPYCYKFTAHAALQEVEKIGCATILCAGIRNHCADIEFQGVSGRMCCCNNQNYCNFSTRPQISHLIPLSLLALFVILKSFVSI